MAKREHVSETPPPSCSRPTRWPTPSILMSTWSMAAPSTALRCWGSFPFMVVKTLIMQDQDAKPLVVLMHGNRKVSTKTWPARSVPSRWSLVPPRWRTATAAIGGGTSPFGTRRDMPVYIEESILGLPRIAINGGRRGFWCRSTRACASNCWVHGPCSAHWQNSRRMRACPYRIYPRSCFDRRVSPFSRRGCLLAGLAVVCCHRHPGDGAQ